MGFGLPSALGAAAALDEPHRDTKPVVDIDGDGSFLMNIQVWGVTNTYVPGAAGRLGFCASTQFTCPRLRQSQHPHEVASMSAGAGDCGHRQAADQDVHPEQPAPGDGGAVGGPVLQGQPRAHLPWPPGVHPVLPAACATGIPV